jgi:membrane protein YdbS with pleckstrin-like domain
LALAGAVKMLSKYHLPNKLPNEKIVKIIRKDIFILLQKVLLFAFLMVLPLGVFYLILSATPAINASILGHTLVVLGASIYYLFIWVFFFFSFIDYYLDVWIITNERIIDIQQEGFFSRTISEHKLFRIQDVTSEVHGMMATLLRFGDVHVQTAGTVQRFNFKDIPGPNRVRDMIIKLVQKKKREQKEDI